MPTLLQTGQVKTNDVGLAYAKQTALGVIPTTGWKTVEPNAFNAFGNTFTRVAREPISQNRQRRKGTITDLDSAAGFDADLTLASARDFIEGFMFTTYINADVTLLTATGADTTTDIYTGLTALSAAQAAKFGVGSLVWAKGSQNAANNGLKSIATAASTSDTTLNVAENLVTETGASILLSIAGFRIPNTDSPTWAWDGSKLGTLANTGIGAAVQARGLTVGQFVHIGSIASAGGAIQNAFENSAANDMFGYARLTQINTDSLIFDKVSEALKFNDSTAPSTPVDIVFGEFLRNVPRESADFCEVAYCMEGSFPGLGDGTPGNSDTSYEYSLDNFCNNMTFNLPLTDKATVGFDFIGTVTNDPTTTQAPGASSAVNPTDVAAFNTSADIARLRITEADESGLTTDFKSLTMTLGNNVSPEKVLGRLGARFLNYGNFTVDIEAQVLFTNPNVITAIRQNRTVSMDFILKNDDGVIAVDIPSMTLGGGDREFPVNESVLLNTQGEAFGDASLNTSLGFSTFPVPFA